MPELTDRGRLLRGGRAVARLLLVWTLVAVSLHLLDLWLTDFAMLRGSRRATTGSSCCPTTG